MRVSLLTEQAKVQHAEVGFSGSACLPGCPIPFPVGPSPSLPSLPCDQAGSSWEGGPGQAADLLFLAHRISC